MPIDESKCKLLGIELLWEGCQRKLYYITTTSQTVKDYLDELKKDSLDRYDGMLAALVKVGVQSYFTKGLVGHLKGKIWEIRPYSDRILYFHDTGDSFILTHCHKKQRNKSRKADIKKAETMRKGYLMRKTEVENENP